MSETEIISRILSGEEHLFTRLVKRYSGYVWALCSSYIRNPGDCEDVAQEVFVHCYSRLHTLRNPAAFGQWLGQLARRHCLMWLRQSGRRERHLAAYEDNLESYIEPPANADAGLAREEMHAGIRDAIDTLPADFREALLLRYAEGYSVADAATFLGISAAAMRKRLERAQAMLKERLWDQVEPALAKRKHKDNLVTGIIAAIPFGKVPWLGVAATAAPASKLAIMGGIAVMWKKLILVVGAIVVVAGAGFVLAGQPWKKVEPSSSPTVSRPAEARSSPADNIPNVPARNTAQRADSGLVTPAVAEKKVEETSQDTAAMPGTAAISGFVKSEAGNPIAGADVYVETGRDRYCVDVVKTYAAKTAADGAYRVSNIEMAVSAYVFASADGYVMQRNAGVRLVGGTELKGVNFLLRSAAYFVAGRVVTQSGAPIPEATVSTCYFGYDEDGLEHTAVTGQTTGNISSSKFFFSITDKDGMFRVAVANEGLCDFQVIKSGYGPGFFPKIATGTEDNVFVLKSPGAIAGKVTRPDGTPLEGVSVHVCGEALPGGLEPSPVRIQRLPVAPVTVTTDSNGAYLAEGLGADYFYTVSVLEPGSVTGTDAAKEEVRGLIAAMVAEFLSGEAAVAAQKADIRVTAGATTSGVDLVVGGTTSAIIRGVVTDRTSGKPVCPVVVAVGSIDESGPRKSILQSATGGGAVTQRDGSYEAVIHNLQEKMRFRVTYMFMTEGGSAWPQPEEDVGELELGPGDRQELNFTVDAPIVVPVRYVDTAGAPVEGIAAGIQREGGGGACGGALISNAEGRVAFHGIPPFVSLQVLAWRGSGGSSVTIGMSEPFSGRPGETVPEVTVVCRMLGGVEAAFVYPDGRPVANTELNCEGRLAGGTASPLSGMLVTDEAGMISVADALPEGVYGNVHVTCIDGQTGQLYSVTTQDIEVVAGTVTNLGTFVMQPEQNWAQLVEAANYGRKGNEAIARNYSSEMLESLPNPGLFSKVAFALYDVGRYEEALEVFRREAEYPNRRDMSIAANWIWQGHMLDLLGRRDEAVAAYANAAAVGATGTMRHDQFGLSYSPTEYAQERMETPFVRVENRME